MTALIVGLGLAVALLAVLVVGLLRSHAEILKALHDLGVNLEDGAPGPRGASLATSSRAPMRTAPGVPRPRGEDAPFGPAVDLSGALPTGGAARAAIAGVEHTTLLAFLSTGCGTCGTFWDALGHHGDAPLPGDATRLVIITNGPESESPAAVADLAPADVLTLMSSEAWDLYQVPVSPYFVLVDGRSSQVIGEGAGTSWSQILDLLSRAVSDRGAAPAPRAAPAPDGRAGPGRPRRCRAAGGGDRAGGCEPLPGHPPLARGRRRRSLMAALAAGGLSIDLPAGWDGSIRAVEPTSVATLRVAAVDAPAPQPSILHAATFPLPAERGDYGSGAVELMGGSDILICLLEHEPEAAGTALFRRQGVPRLRADRFSPQSMQRALPGMAGTQHFFQVDGRPFCLYVVVGSWTTRGPLVRAADQVVQTLRLDAAHP